MRAIQKKSPPFAFWKVDEQVVGKKAREKGWAKNEKRPQTVMKHSLPYLASNEQFLHTSKPSNACPELGFRKYELIPKGKEDRAGEGVVERRGWRGLGFASLFPPPQAHRTVEIQGKAATDL